MTILLWTTSAVAKKKDPIHGFRMGICGGFSTDCLFLSAKLEYSGRFVGVNVSLPIVPVWASGNLKIYPIEVIENHSISWRPYGYIGSAFVIYSDGLTGGGLGADVHLLKSRKLLLQPTIGIMTDGTVLPSGGLSIMAAF